MITIALHIQPLCLASASASAGNAQMVVPEAYSCPHPHIRSQIFNLERTRT